MDNVEKYIDDLVTIGKWAKSCKTPEQFKNVKNFLDKQMDRTKGIFILSAEQQQRVSYHIGFIDGMMFAIDKLKISKKWEKTTMK